MVAVTIEISMLLVVLPYASAHGGMKVLGRHQQGNRGQRSQCRASLNVSMESECQNLHLLNVLMLVLPEGEEGGVSGEAPSLPTGGERSGEGEAGSRND